LQSKANIEKIQWIATQIGAVFGVSRPVTMRAWADMAHLIGVSGTCIAPEICIAAGVSGSAAFYAGIEKSKTIIAINTDQHAPIMKLADVTIADDATTILEALLTIMSAKTND